MTFASIPFKDVLLFLEVSHEADDFRLLDWAFWVVLAEEPWVLDVDPCFKAACCRDFQQVGSELAERCTFPI